MHCWKYVPLRPSFCLLASRTSSSAGFWLKALNLRENQVNLIKNINHSLFEKSSAFQFWKSWRPLPSINLPSTQEFTAASSGFMLHLLMLLNFPLIYVSSFTEEWCNHEIHHQWLPQLQESPKPSQKWLVFSAWSVKKSQWTAIQWPKVMFGLGHFTFLPFIEILLKSPQFFHDGTAKNHAVYPGLSH